MTDERARSLLAAALSDEDLHQRAHAVEVWDESQWSKSDRRAVRLIAQAEADAIAKVVAWLRTKSSLIDPEWFPHVADAIERGDHLQGEDEQ